jgi:hypothetical protein
MCPTNLDPAYDKSPDKYYKCRVCQRAGKHYTSLCPSNTDPESITQKRKALQDQKDTESRDGREDRGDLIDGWTREGDNSGKLNATPDHEKAQKSRDAFASLNNASRTGVTSHMDLERARILGWDSISVDEDGDLVATRTNTTMTRVPTSPRNGPSRTGSLSNSTTKLSSLSFDRRQNGERSRKRVRFDNNDDEQDTGYRATDNYPRSDHEIKLDLSSEDEDVSDVAIRTGDEPKAKGVFGFKMNSAMEQVVTQVDEVSSDEDDIPILAPPIKEYRPFVAQLMAIHPQLNDAVNAPPRRSTALEMWNKDEDRRKSLYGTRYDPIFGCMSF